MKESIPRGSKCPTLNWPPSISPATRSTATGTTRSRPAKSLEVAAGSQNDRLIYGQALRVRCETRRGPLGVLFGMNERPEEWALRLLRWKPKPLITRSAKAFETDSKTLPGRELKRDKRSGGLKAHRSA